MVGPDAPTFAIHGPVILSGISSSIKRAQIRMRSSDFALKRLKHAKLLHSYSNSYSILLNLRGYDRLADTEKTSSDQRTH